MELRRNIIEAVDHKRARITSLLARLVKVPSVAPGEKLCQELVATELDKIGLEVDKWDADIVQLRRHPWYVPTDLPFDDRPNVVGRLRGAGGGRSLILNAHVDVVPVDEPERWSHGPWNAEIEGGRMYGRGTADCKAGLAASIVAVETIQELGITLCGDVIVESAIGEETGHHGVLACILRGYKAGAAILAEPTTLALMQTAMRGRQDFRIRVRGQKGRLEDKHRLVHPIEKGLKIFEAVEGYSTMRESLVADHPLLFWTATKVPLGIGKMWAGDDPDNVPGECLMEGYLTCLPEENIETIKSRFAQFVSQLARGDPWLRGHPPVLEWIGRPLEGVEVPQESPFVQLLADISEDVVGSRPQCVAGGLSDQPLLVQYADTPTVLFGPSWGNVHGVDEYVELESVVDCTKIFAAFIAEWCRVA